MTTKEKPTGRKGALSLGGVSLGGLLSEATGTAQDNLYNVPKLDIALIDPDPNQPRKHFDPEELAALSESIRDRGVKTPISVRPHPFVQGRYMLNHGERRLRAATMAGLSEIPGYVDMDYNDEDQVHENLHRSSLTPREIAEYIDTKLKQGLSKGEVAAKLKVSSAFVTQHCALLDLPGPIAAAYRAGRVNDVTLIYNLCTLFKKDSKRVEAWLAFEMQDITRGTVASLKGLIEEKTGSERRGSQSSADVGHSVTAGGGVDEAQQPPPEPTSPSVGQRDDEQQGQDEGRITRAGNPQKIKNPLIRVIVGDRHGSLKPGQRPSKPIFGVVCFDEGGSEEVPLDTITIFEIIES